MRCTIKDKQRLEYIFNHPSVIDDVTDDGLKRIHLGSVIESESVCFLSPVPEVAFMFVKQNQVMYEVHTAVLPEARGAIAIKAGKSAAEWMFDNTSCKKIVSYIPVNNKKALKYALLVGFKKEGLVSKSFQKDSILYDQHIVGLEKGELCQQRRP